MYGKLKVNTYFLVKAVLCYNIFVSRGKMCSNAIVDEGAEKQSMGWRLESSVYHNKATFYQRR